mgnify:CR=1 FL=1
MKLLQSINTELREQQQLDEVNILKRGLSKAAGKVGFKGQAAEVEQQHAADQKIKQLNLDFRKWAGSQKKRAKDMTGKDLHTFLGSKGLVQPQELLQFGKKAISQIPKETIKKAFHDAVTGTVKRQTRQAAKAGGEQQLQQAPEQGQQPQQTAQQGQQSKDLGGLASAMKFLKTKLTPADQKTFAAYMQKAFA